MSFESAENYYEHLVADELRKQLKGNKLGKNQDFIEDVACVALNQLPVRYVRHHVDLIYYLTDEERAAINENVTGAVKEAIEFVQKHRSR